MGNFIEVATWAPLEILQKGIRPYQKVDWTDVGGKVVRTINLLNWGQGRKKHWHDKGKHPVSQPFSEAGSNLFLKGIKDKDEKSSTFKYVL